jgi:hypothetical protein
MNFQNKCKEVSIHDKVKCHKGVWGKGGTYFLHYQKMEVSGDIHCDNITHEGKVSGTHWTVGLAGLIAVWMRLLHGLNYTDQNNLRHNSVEEHFIAVSNDG